MLQFGVATISSLGYAFVRGDHGIYRSDVYDSVAQMLGKFMIALGSGFLCSITEGSFDKNILFISSSVVGVLVQALYIKYLEKTRMNMGKRVPIEQNSKLPSYSFLAPELTFMSSTFLLLCLKLIVVFLKNKKTK